jgi:flagellar biosynthesis chaperone FliJ
MRRFRFPLDSYLRLLRQQVESAEARLAKLRAQQHACTQRADELMAQRHGALADNTGQSVLDGAVLASLDRWRTGLAQQSANCLRDAGALEGPLQEAMVEIQALKRRVELMERLRERRSTEHRRQEDREAEQIASELYLGNLHRRGV